MAETGETGVRIYKCKHCGKEYDPLGNVSNLCTIQPVHRFETVTIGIPDYPPQG